MRFWMVIGVVVVGAGCGGRRSPAAAGPKAGKRALFPRVPLAPAAAGELLPFALVLDGHLAVGATPGADEIEPPEEVDPGAVGQAAVVLRAELEPDSRAAGELPAGTAVVLYGRQGALCRGTLGKLRVLGQVHPDRSAMEGWGLIPRYASEEAAVANQPDEIPEASPKDITSDLWSAAATTLARELDAPCRGEAVWAVPEALPQPQLLELAKPPSAVETAARAAVGKLRAGLPPAQVTLARGPTSQWILLTASSSGCDGFEGGLLAAARVRDGRVETLHALEDDRVSAGAWLAAFERADGTLGVVMQEDDTRAPVLVTFAGSGEVEVESRLAIPFTGRLGGWDYICGD